MDFQDKLKRTKRNVRDGSMISSLWVVLCSDNRQRAFQRANRVVVVVVVLVLWLFWLDDERSLPLV